MKRIVITLIFLILAAQYVDYRNQKRRFDAECEKLIEAEREDFYFRMMQCSTLDGMNECVESADRLREKTLKHIKDLGCNGG